MNKFRVPVLILLVVVTWSVLSRLVEVEPYTFKTTAFNTFVEVIFDEGNQDNRNKIELEIINVLNFIERELNSHNETSYVSILNKYGKGSYTKSMLFILAKAYEMTAMTDGAFDITVAPAVDLWKKAIETGVHPANEEIKFARELVGTSNILITQERIVFKKKGMKIDFGAIAKGYAIDLIGLILEDYKVYNAVVNIGGDLLVIGSGPKYRGWKIGIRNPDSKSKDKMLGEILVRQKAVATSGDYEQYRKIGRKKVSHIVDPRTADMPKERLKSVTVLSKDAITSDALATAFMVMGRKKAIELSNMHIDIDTMVIDKRGRIYYSNDWPYKKFSKK